jgi:hypothetical protein
MNIKVLSKEESLAYWNEVREENKGLAPHQIEHWIKSIPQTGGQTMYIIGEDNWDKFYKWIYTLEGQEKWQEDLDLTTYIENWWKENGETTEV